MDLSTYRNQSGIFNIDEYDYLKLAIIGTGSIGSFLALAINKLGFQNLLLIDDDKIEQHNIPTQFYFHNDANEFKVKALEKYLEGNTTTFVTKVKANHRIDADIAFICVDSLEQRKIIMKAVLDSYEKYKKPKLVIDGRMHRLIFRIFTIPLHETELLKNYVEGLIDEEFDGDCTEKGIIQNVFVIVAVMIEQLRKVISGESYSAVINCDFEQYDFLLSKKINIHK